MFLCFARRVEITRKGEVYKMVISDLTQEDTAEYACQVGNRPSKANVLVEECMY